ncbi:MAG TPA: hypothetical protein D7H74_00185 [Candidatus Poseidoniales archaeon]|nr:MAG TPA: hypothetical protein D7H74_00185 [Candidatus Poseidoniales archaeon]
MAPEKVQGNLQKEIESYSKRKGTPSLSFVWGVEHAKGQRQKRTFLWSLWNGIVIRQVNM